MNRFFRTSEAVYTATRAQLDAAFDHPGPYADTCLPPAEEAPKDAQGRVYLAVLDSMFQWPVVQENVAALMVAGLVEEVTEADYRATFPPPPTPL